MNCWEVLRACNRDWIISSQATSHLVEGSETTGEKTGSLNNQNQRPADVKSDDIVRSLWKHKVNIYVGFEEGTPLRGTDGA